MNNYEVLAHDDPRAKFTFVGRRCVGCVLRLDDREIDLDNLEELQSFDNSYGSIVTGKPGYGEVWVDGEYFIAKFSDKGDTLAVYMSKSIEAIMNAIIVNITEAPEPEEVPAG